MTKFIPNDQEKVVEDAAIRDKRNEVIASATPRNKTLNLRRGVYWGQPLQGRPKERKTELKAEAKGENSQSERRRKTKENRRQKPKRKLKKKTKIEVEAKKDAKAYFWRLRLGPKEVRTGVVRWTELAN